MSAAARPPAPLVIDTGYIGPEVDAVHVLFGGSEAALIDTGVGSSAPAVLSGLAAAGVHVNDVRYIILTHVHLDHAGGAGALMRALPRAELVVHPRGARHMIAPERLIAGSVAVYGAELFQQLYGEILPVPAERVRVTEDEGRLDFGGRALRFLHTLGHAKHHHCVVDEAGGAVFTGDTFGLAYPALQRPGHPFLMATTTPVDFDPPALRASIRRIAACGADTAYLTHFGPVIGLAVAAAQLLNEVDAMVRLCAETAHLDESDLSDAIFAHWMGRLRAAGHPGEAADLAPSLRFDAPLNAQGLRHWWATGGRP